MALSTSAQMMTTYMRLDAHTGDRLWRYRTKGNVDSSPAVVDGVVYVGSDDNYLYALDADTGTLLWRYETDDEVDSSPAVVDGVVYVGSDDDYLYALAADTGRLLWRLETGDDINSSPTVKNDIIYIGSNDDYLYAVDTDSGRMALAVSDPRECGILAHGGRGVVVYVGLKRRLPLRAEYRYRQTSLAL